MNPRELLAQATPRPWARYPLDGIVPAISLSEDHPEWYGVATTFLGAVAMSERQTHANAELIVAAVNEYEALLEVEASLRAVADFLAGPYRDHAKGALAHLDEIRGRT